MSYPVFQVPAGDVLPVMFNTYAGSTGASVTLTGLAVTDIEIYKDGSVTQRASDAGYVLLDTDGIDFDAITGIHGFSIDTGDNTDASFYTVGAWFTVVVSAVTVDSQTVNFIACQFRLMAAESIAAKPKVDVDAWLGTAAATPTVAGVPEVDLTHVAGATTNVAALATNVDAILTDTADMQPKLGTPAGASISADLLVIDNFVDGIESTLGAAGAGLTAVPWNAAWDAEVQSEVNDGLVAFWTSPATLVELVWDEVLTGATHNIASSAGRRLRTLQTGGNYENGMVWVDTVNGVAGTTVDENGVVTNPVSTWADALTISAAIPLNAFHIANGSTVTLTAASSNYTLEGHEWTLALGGQSVASTMVINGAVSGTGTGGGTEFEDCIFGITSLESMQAYNCSFTATTSGGFTMSAAGDYRFINCQSGVAGSGAPLFTLGTGAITAEFRRWSGGIQIAGISADDTLTIGGELGTVTLSGADGTVEIRGSYKAIVDNRTGSPTLNLNGAFKAADVASILEDTGTTLQAELDGIQADTEDLQTRIPAALVSGRIDASVGAMAANVLTATAINADAITAAKVAADVHQETIELAFTYDATADYATATAGALVKEIADNAGGSALTAAAIADAVWDEAQADHVAAGSFGVTASEIADILVDTAEIGAAGAGLTDITLNAASVDLIWDEPTSGHATAGTTGKALTDAGSAGDPWSTALPGAYGAGTAGYIVGTDIPAILVDTAEIGAAGAGLTNINLPNQTMDITGNITGNLSGSVGSVTGAVGSVTGNVGGNVVGSVASVTAAVGITAAAVDAIWDEDIVAAHTTADTSGKKLADAGGAADPWATAIPGAYGAGTAGKILGDNIDAAISTRMPTTHISATGGAVDNVTLVDTTTTNTDMRGTDSAATATNLATVDTVVDAIKVKTDSLTFTKAGEVDSNTQSINGVTITGDGGATPFDV